MVNSPGWAVIHDDNSAHVFPINDVRWHDIDGLGCKCDPKIESVDGFLVVTHNAFDNREIVEQAEQYIKEWRSRDG
jgi:hypothetical protein